MAIQKAKFSIGDIVKHKHFEFRGVIYDVDFEFNNSEEWYQSIPKNVKKLPLVILKQLQIGFANPPWKYLVKNSLVFFCQAKMKNSLLGYCYSFNYRQLTILLKYL